MRLPRHPAVAYLFLVRSVTRHDRGQQFLESAADASRFISSGRRDILSSGVLFFAAEVFAKTHEAHGELDYSNYRRVRPWADWHSSV
jgi:hypothetical protein